MSLQRRLLLLLAALVVIFGAGLREVIRAVEAHDRTAHRTELQVADIRLLTSQVLTDFLDQETGVRGFVVTGDDGMLQPYATGQIRAVADESRLRVATRSTAKLQEPLAAMIEAGRSWQAIATAEIATRRTSTAAAAAIVAGDGRARFDRFRNAVGAMQDAIATKSNAARRPIRDAHRHAELLAWIGLAGVMVFVTAAGSLVWSWVARPIRRIRADIGAVIAGDTAGPISQTGPHEIAALARDVEVLRAGMAGGRADAEDTTRLGSDVMAKMGDEIRSPMNTLLGMLSLLTRTNLDAEQRDYTRTAQGSAETLLSIIDGALVAPGAPSTGDRAGIAEPVPASAERPEPGALESGILDPAILEQLRDLGERSDVDLVAQLADVIARDVPLRIQAIREAIAAGDGDQLAREAHSLKGSTGNVGALQMAQWCAEMERLGQAGQPSAAAVLTTRVEDQLEAVLAALRAPRP